MLIDWREISDGETWEHFCRDFLSEKGFVIDVGPGRGADAGRDLLVSEQLGGLIHRQRFKWLVSCKHFAKRGKSIGTETETDILDRVNQHKADGFLGFYSTLPSESLLDRLRSLEAEEKINAYTIFDHPSLEGHFINTGLSHIALQYFPKSYADIRPIQQIFDEQPDVRCECCGEDWLKRSVTEPKLGILVWAIPRENRDHFERLYVVCKGDCDQKLEQRLWRQGYQTRWEDISVLCNPLTYLHNVITYTNMLYQCEYTLSEEAHSKMKQIYIAFAQRVLREVNREDREKFLQLQGLEGL